MESYYREEAYIDAVTETIRATGFGQGVSDRLLFAFHSIPVSDIEGGDTYPEQTEQTARAVADKLGLLDDDCGSDTRAASTRVARGSGLP